MEFLTTTYNGDKIFFWATQKDLYDADKIIDAYIDSAGELIPVWVRMGDLENVEPVESAE